MQTLSKDQVRAADLADWRMLAQGLHGSFRAADPPSAAAFVGAVVGLGERSGRRPELKLVGEVVDVVLWTRSDGVWVTASDVDLARAVSGLARDDGLTPDPGAVAQLELGLDTAQESVAGPFWSALLTGDAANTVHDSVIDPAGRVANVWFQGTGAHATPRQRWHLDLWLAPEVAAGRIAAAVAAGGTVVDDGEAPSFTILADPEGNRVCVCTSDGRD